MFRKTAIAALVIAAAAGAATAQTATPGNVMLSNLQDVTPGTYTIAELIQLGNVRSEGDSRVAENYILNQTAGSVTGRANTAGVYAANAGANQLAAKLGVDASAFTLPQLIQLDNAVQENDRTTIRAIFQDAGVTAPASVILR